MLNLNPNVSFQSNPQVNETSNMIDKYKESHNNNSTEQINEKDSVVITKDFIADLKINKDKAALGTIVDGHVNGKSAAFKVVSNNDDESWFEGLINKKYLLLHCNDKQYNGKYGDSDFNLTIDYNKPSKLSVFFNQKIMGKIFLPDYFVVKGNIGNKVVDIRLPEAKIPSDPETRDILTMILEDNGLKAQTVNGEVKSLKFASSAVKDIKQRAERRQKMISDDIKPIFMQGISSATGMIIGSLVSAMLLKFGLKR